MKAREKLCWWADCCPTRLIPVQAWLSSGGQSHPRHQPFARRHGGRTTEKRDWSLQTNQEV